MFDYVQNIRSQHTVPCTSDILHTVMRSTIVNMTCAEIKDALEKVKRGEMSRDDFETYKREHKQRLPAFCFQAHFTEGHRRNAEAVPSGLSILDIDHVKTSLTPAPSADPRIAPPPREGSGERLLMDRLIDHLFTASPVTDAPTIAQLRKLGIALVHITPSTEGLRLVFALHDGESPKDGQQRMARSLNLGTFDEACKDLARCSFAVPESYVLYVDEKILWPHPVPSPEGEGSNMAEAGKAGAASGAAAAAKPAGKAGASIASIDSIGSIDSIASIKSMAPAGAADSSPSSGEIRGEALIFDRVVASTGLTLSSLNNVGTRHNSLTAVLSTGICRLMPQDRLWAVICQRMPDYAREPDCRQLVNDFYTKYTDNNRPMSAKLRRIFVDSLHAAAQAEQDEQDEQAAMAAINANDAAAPSPCRKGNKRKASSAVSALSSPSSGGGRGEASGEAFPLPSLPVGLKATLDGVPKDMRMPVLCAVLPLAAAYADGVTVRYCDGMLQRLNLMSIIVGPQASGKSACKAKIDLWMRQMADDDARAREIEEKWKQARKCRKANEKAPEDPCVLIRSVPVTISCSTLLRRFKNSRGHTLYSFGEELDTLRKTNGAGSWSSKYDIYRLAFDNGQWGQDYNSDQAESGVVNVAYNFSILGTYGALRKCFKSDNVENGLSSRILIAEMPDASFAPMPTFGQTTAKTAAAINQAVSLLRAAQGFVDTPRLRKAIGEWVEQKRVEAMADGDLVKDTYRKRAAVIGFRCGVVARLLEGKETKKVIEFALMMAQYVLDGQCRLFGRSLLGEYKQAADEQQRFTTNGSVFDNLPVSFTLTDLEKLKGPDTSRSTLFTIISRWKKAQWIEKTGVNSWRKISAV